jgi:phage terminase large subunit-like protein
MGRKKKHQSLVYAEKVTAGKIVACRWVILSCQRHIDDLKRKDIFFDEEAADHMLEFCGFLKHSKGEWEGQTFVPELWEIFIISMIFGWKLKSGLRRFRTVYICVSRKNGKSFLLSSAGNYLFIADDEPGAEVYTAATKYKQAAIVHSESTRMVKSSPFLRDRIKVHKNNLHIVNTASKYEPLGADSKTEDGLNVHGALIDELHAHPNRDMWDVLETATGSRRQPLQIAITTAGFDQAGICYEQHQYVQSILKGTIKDDSYFGIIYTLDLKKEWPELREKHGEGNGELEDDWQDEKCWIKANPNLGVSVKLDDLRRKAKKAAEIPAAQNNFLTKHMDVWTQQFSRWISLDVWDSNLKNAIDEKELAGRNCCGGIDLSSVADLTCWVMAFPGAEDPESIDIIMRCWCPESKLYDKKNKYKDRYQEWEKAGYLETTEGDAIDYKYVRAAVVADAKKFHIDSIGVDRLFQGYEFSMTLNEELGGTESDPKVFACGMGYMSMAGPCQEFERRLLERKINHGGNPILRFMIDSVAVSEDPAGNKKPNKDKSQGKIDGIISTLLALDRLMRVDITNMYANGSEVLFI